MSVQSHCFTHLSPPWSLFLPPVPPFPFFWSNCSLCPGSFRFGRQAWATGECHFSITPPPTPIPPHSWPISPFICLAVALCLFFFFFFNKSWLIPPPTPKSDICAQFTSAYSGLLTKDHRPSSPFPCSYMHTGSPHLSFKTTGCGVGGCSSSKESVPKGMLSSAWDSSPRGLGRDSSPPNTTVSVCARHAVLSSSCELCPSPVCPQGLSSPVQPHVCG